MNTNEKFDPSIVLDIIEDELEERQTKSDRRQQQLSAEEALKVEEDRRSGADRRND